MIEREMREMRGQKLEYFSKEGKSKNTLFVDTYFN